MRLKITRELAILVLAVPFAAMSQGSKPEYHGAGWVQVGRVEESYTTQSRSLTNDYRRNWIQNSGVVLNSSIKIDEHWEGKFEIGAIQVHLPRGNKGIASIWYPFVVPFVSEARITYSSKLFSDSDNLKLTLGSFPYGYNSDVKNLGNYLLNGYTYPGIIESGFTGPLGVFRGMSGALVSYSLGGFKNDFIVKLETEDKPLYDVSIANILDFQVAPGVQFGAGVNFYRAIPQISKVTSPGKDCNPNDLGTYAPAGNINPCFEVSPIAFDTSGNPTAYDTVMLSLAGTKAMARLRLDPKAWFGKGPFGTDDWILYGEGAILGVKNYGKSYDDIKRRMPVMVGINLPTLGMMNLSIEGEYFASKNSGDNLAAQNGSPVPSNKDPDVKYGRDDIKWSVNASKVFFGHMWFAIQVANDHLRLGGFHNESAGVETLTTPKDWYWTSKLAFFF